MKIAIVHDYIKEYGGAERVLEALHELYPDATVFTTVYLPEFLGPHRERFKDWNIKTSWLQHLPLKTKLISPLRLFSPLVFSCMNLKDYDAVIVSATGAYAPNFVRTKSGAHICYCHTPPRYLYGYATARDWKKNPLMLLFGLVFNPILRSLDKISSKRVDFFIANSEEVKSRIKRFYKRDAVVIYPPVETASSLLASSVQLSEKKLNANFLDAKRYFLAGGRLARPKHIDLIVKTCAQMGLALKVFGRGFAGYEKEIKNQKSKIKTTDQNAKIEFLGEVTDAEKFALMEHAKAYIFASEDEDFGITPVEAMMSGIPVIAYKSGGVKETVVEGKTGVFFNQLTIASLTKAIEQFTNTRFDRAAITKHAILFGKGMFQKKIRAFLSEKLHE